MPFGPRRKHSKSDLPNSLACGVIIGMFCFIVPTVATCFNDSIIKVTHFFTTMDLPINYLAVAVAGIINMVLGFLWYGPFFGKSWMKLMGFTEEYINTARQKGMTPTYIAAFVMAIVMAYVLAYFVSLSGAMTIATGMMIGFWAWLGFVLPIQSGSIFWEGKSMVLLLINAGYYLVALLIMGALLAGWR